MRTGKALCWLALAGALAGLSTAPAQDACRHRGDLDTPFCDEDGDLLADTPREAKLQKDPDSLFFTNSPLEDPAVFKELMRPFVEHLAQCTARKVRFYDVYSSAAAIEAMRSGRMHLGTLSSGDTAFAVNVAGAIPIGIRGDAGGPQGYQLWVIVKKDSPYQKLADLKGKRVAHTAPSSNSGNLAPRTLFPPEGLTPDKDYKVLFSGKHENSVSGVASGDFDAAPIAHDILLRMAGRGLVKLDDFRIIWKSRNFPPGGLSMAHDLAPALQKKIRECTYAYRYSPEMVKGFQGADRWLPIDYKQDWELIRRVAQESGQAFTRTAFEREKTRAQAAGEEVKPMRLAEELPLTLAESRLLETARDFSRREVAPNAARWERERAYPRETIRAAAALGLTRIQIPAAQGGLDLRYRAKLRIVEEIARDDFGFAFALVNTHNAASRLARDGTDGQRARYLAGLLRGELIGAVALTEPEAGSDFGAIRTRAERVAGGWRLNGEKAWLTNGAAVDVVVVYAQTDPVAGNKGIAAFVVDAKRDGFERGAAYGMSGAHALGAAGLRLTDYFAADDDLFYAPGAAFKTALGSITGARIYVAAMCCGMVEEALERALAHARSRSTFGEPLIKRQGLRWMLADVATDLEAARLLAYRATRLLEEGADAVLAAAHAKKFAARMAERRLPECMQVLGAGGLLDAHPIGRHIAAARVAHYTDGTTEIQNERIAAYLERGIDG